MKIKHTIIAIVVALAALFAVACGGGGNGGGGGTPEAKTGMFLSPTGMRTRCTPYAKRT